LEEEEEEEDVYAQYIDITIVQKFIFPIQFQPSLIFLGLPNGVF
jgi:hypothetical protein